MVADPKAPSRAELSRFLPTAQLVRTFERLFDKAGSVTPTDAEAAQMAADNAGARAQEGLDSIDRLTKAVEALAAAQQHDVIGNSIKVDFIDFTDNGHNSTDKRVWWDVADGTLDIGMAGGVVTQQVGQEIFYYVKNTSAADIGDGDAVMATGVVGASGRITVAKAVADGSVDPKYMLGIATMTIPQNTFGYVTFFGLVRGIDTTGTPYGEVWADGDILYFHPTTAGWLTKTQPTAPAIKSPIAIVTYSGAGGSGSIFVRMTNGLRIKDLHDVSAAAPRDLDLLQYSNALGRWESNQEVWADIDFPIIIRTTGAGIPALTAINGNITMPQWQVNDVNICESQEFVHQWSEGTTCYWHIHLTTNGLDAANRYVRFEVEYGYVNPSGVWVFPATADSGDLLIPASTADKTMLIFELASFTSAGLKIGGHAVARLKRIASAGTAPTNDPWVSMLQLHVKLNTLGSRNKTTK